jgi:chromosomal replication initiator protein
LLEKIYPRMNENSYFTWILPIIPLRNEEQKVVVQVPSQFFLDWVNSHYGNLITRELKTILGYDVKLVYEIVEISDDLQELKDLLDDKEYTPNITDYLRSTKHPFKNNLNNEYIFKNFIIDEGNRFALAGAYAAALDPGNTPFNPLIIYGEQGSGKTHLLHAIGNEVKRKLKNKEVLLISGEKLIKQLYEEKSKNKVNEYLYLYRSKDLFILDDLQFLLNDEIMQNIFLSILNLLNERNTQIVLSCDKSPYEYENINDKLFEYFKKGVIAGIGALSLDTKIAILKNKLQSSGYQLSDEIIEYIAGNVTANTKQVKKIINRIMKETSRSHCEIDFNFIENIIKRNSENKTF